MMRSRTIIAIPPGETIREQLIDRDMTQKEFAVRIGMSEKHISRLINGDVQLTPDVAVRLEMVLDIPAHFWSNLESIYREKLSKAQMENEMDDDLEFLSRIPYNEMAKNQWVESTRSKTERVFNLRKFFEVVRLSVLTNDLIPNIACRRLGEGSKSDYALISWAQKAKLESRSVETGPIDIEKLKELIPEIRTMTRQDPAFFCELLCKKLSECGIALIFLPHIGGSFLHGATFYDKSKIVIGMTVRGKDADKFWFSLFHEIGHIILGHIDLAEGVTDQDERDADFFARNTLIPDNEFKKFAEKKSFDKISVKIFSEEIGVDVGIVVGRLQKENLIPFNRLNGLKIKYKLTA
ncbi:MAG: HigA family addiction module antitoxin [Peptostreptococcaceae bacterium]|nr:HigA family addiction module antitoxin [Peptostreptococcaceae bacterium]